MCVCVRGVGGVQTSTVESIGPPRLLCVKNEWSDGQKRQEIFYIEIKATRFDTLKFKREENKNNATFFMMQMEKNQKNNQALRFTTINFLLAPFQFNHM